jgi:RNA polymerase sigma factor (sigma-70 family)
MISLRPEVLSPSVDATDAVLFTQAKKPDQEAAFALFRRYAPRLRAMINRLLAARLRSILDADDLLQEVAVVLLTKPLPGAIGSTSGFLRYVGGIARNITLAQNRRHLDGRHHNRHREISLCSVDEREFSHSYLPDAAARLLDRERLANLLEWAPSHVVEVVAWFCAGYSAAEIALALGIREETVVQLVCAANNFGPGRERPVDPTEMMRSFGRLTTKRLSRV